MASPSERSRNNVKAGLFVLVSLVLALATIISLTDIWQKISRPTKEYTVVFDVMQGVKNLKAGGKVRVGGVDMGSVVAVVPEIVPGKPLERVIVTFELADNVELFDGAKVIVTSALIGADAWLDITDVGNPDRPLPATGIEGYTVSGALGAIVGSQNAEKFDSMFDDAQASIDNIKVATGDVRALTGRIRHEDWPHWATKISSIVDWGAGATTQLDRILIEGEGLLADAHAVIADNRDSIDSIAANVEVTSEDMRAVMSRFRTESMDRLNRMLESGERAMTRTESILVDLGMAVDGWVPQFNDALADIRLTAQQIKLTAIELRRGPWKLLYRPSDNELEHELLYDSVRGFAFAAADMKATAASVERVLEMHGADLPKGDAEVLEQLTANLLESMKNYNTAQQKLLDTLESE